MIMSSNGFPELVFESQGGGDISETAVSLSRE